MTLEAEFLTTAADKLAENLDRIETCLTELPPHSLWARDSGQRECGRQLAAASGRERPAVDSLRHRAAPDGRDRPGEFSARAGGSASVLLARLRGTVGEASGPDSLSATRAARRTGLHPRLRHDGALGHLPRRRTFFRAHLSNHSPDQALHWKGYSGSTATWTRRGGGKPSRRVDERMSRRRFYTNAMHTGAGLSSFASVCVSAPVFRSIFWTRVTLVFCPSVKT